MSKALLGENVYAFSIGLASLQIQQFLSFVLQPKKFTYGPKEMDFVTGTIDSIFDFTCNENCELKDFIGSGDGIKSYLIQTHPIAITSRAKAKSYSKRV